MMRLLSSILLSLVLLQSAGPIVLLQLQQKQIRREMKRAIRAGMPEEQLLRFEFAADGGLVGGGRVEWIEPHEFRYRGVMYDIARTVEEDGRTVRYCVRDDAETAVYAQLDRLVREETNRDPEQRNTSTRLLRQFMVPALLPGTIPTQTEYAATPMILSDRAHPLRGEHQPPTPPPRG